MPSGKFHKTCSKCGNMGPPVPYVTKQGVTKKVCAWCLDELEKKIRRRRERERG